MKRIISITIWFSLFLIVPVFIFGFLAGIFLGGMYLIEGQENAYAKGVIGTLWAIVGLIGGLAGLILGISGKLPGTKRN